MTNRPVMQDPRLLCSMCIREFQKYSVYLRVRLFSYNASMASVLI